MHIELDVMEIAFLILLLYAVKWGFRLVVLLFIGKILEGFKRKGEEKLNGIKQGFGQFGNSKGENKNSGESD